ncbi:hypothetical protein GZL_07548 [Streptomyces sp. 769]|nr:hypothetical protein GZL_07548 [Streptomyces sp. 769]
MRHRKSSFVVPRGRAAPTAGDRSRNPDGRETQTRPPGGGRAYRDAVRDAACAPRRARRSTGSGWRSPHTTR